MQPATANKTVHPWVTAVINERMDRYERQFGKVSDELHPLLLEMITQNLSSLGEHPYDLSKPVFEKYCLYREALTRHANRENPHPLAGDRVFLRTTRDTEYTHALFSDRTDTDRLVVCTQPYEPHLFDVPEVGKDLRMSVSGGYFQAVDGHQIDIERGPDKIRCRYWTWLSKPVANGGLYISVEMLRWHLKDGTHDFY